MRRGQHEAALATLEQLDASGDLNSRGLELWRGVQSQKLWPWRAVAQSGPRLRSAKERLSRRSTSCWRRPSWREIRRWASAGIKRPSRPHGTRLPRSARRLPQAIVLHARADGRWRRTRRRGARAARPYRETGDAAALRPLRGARAARSAGTARSRRKLASETTRGSRAACDVCAAVPARGPHRQGADDISRRASRANPARS